MYAGCHKPDNELIFRKKTKKTEKYSQSFH